MGTDSDGLPQFVDLGPGDPGVLSDLLVREVVLDAPQHEVDGWRWDPEYVEVLVLDPREHLRVRCPGQHLGGDADRFGEMAHLRPVQALDRHQVGVIDSELHERSQ